MADILEGHQQGFIELIITRSIHVIEIIRSRIYSAAGRLQHGSDTVKQLRRPTIPDKYPVFIGQWYEPHGKRKNINRRQSVFGALVIGFPAIFRADSHAAVKIPGRIGWTRSSLSFEF